MTQSVHELTVRRLAASYRQARRNGFAKAVRQAFTDEGSHYPGALFIPDLWWKDGDKWGTFTCVEVEDDNPISADKLALYTELWFDLDSVNWELRLLTADRWGRLTPIPLQEYWSASRQTREADRAA